MLVICFFEKFSRLVVEAFASIANTFKLNKTTKIKVTFKTNLSLSRVFVPSD